MGCEERHQSNCDDDDFAREPSVKHLKHTSTSISYVFDVHPNPTITLVAINTGLSRAVFLDPRQVLRLAAGPVLQEALDPGRSPDLQAAHQKMEDCEFAAARLRTSLPRLRSHLERVWMPKPATSGRPTSSGLKCCAISPPHPERVTKELAGRRCVPRPGYL